MKPKLTSSGKGWRQDPLEHGLAAKGIKTKGIEPFFPLGRGRKLGSIASIGSERDAAIIKQKMEKQGYNTEVIPSVDKEKTVVFYKKGTPEVKEALELYKKYEKDPTPDVLSLKEHEKLGEAFGIPKRERKWFLEEMKEEGVK